MWVPGPSNFDGNEKADKLTRLGSFLNIIEREPYSPVAKAKVRYKVW